MAKRSPDRASADALTPDLFACAPAPAAPDAARAPEPERPAEPAAYTVSGLTAAIHGCLGGLGGLRVEGELSSVKRASSGHLYFDLKDEGARIACVVWRSGVSRAVRFEPEEGMQVVAKGRLDVYAPRGTYSLIVDRLEPLGAGALLARLEELKRELLALGWFERRRALPFLPRPIGIVTSRDGAALRDFLRTRSLRWPGYPVRLAHTAVQGPGAAGEIAAAIERLDRSGVALIVLARGGGSLEDLWAFNERAVAAAIWRASVPVVSGVGHESDSTLADLVADHRAHTPTDAAQTVIPDRAGLVGLVQRQGNFLIAALDRALERRERRLAELRGRRVLASAGWIVAERARALEAAESRLGSGARAALSARESALHKLATRLERQSPGRRIEVWEGRVARARGRLFAGGRDALERADRALALASRALESTSPLKVLSRGYSLTRRVGSAAPLVDAADLAPGDELETRLGRGSVRSRVTDVDATEDAGRA